MMQPRLRVPPWDRPATYKNPLKVPDIMVAEVVDGDLQASPRPAPRHPVTGAVMSGRLAPPFFDRRGGSGGWGILSEPERQLRRDVLATVIVQVLGE